MQSGADSLFLFGSIGAANAQNPIFVSVTPAGLADGSDWDNAAALITAISQVQSSGGGTIYMDKGTYLLTADLPTFDKTMDLTILGGFDVAGGTTTTAQRAAISYWTLNPTVIHGGSAFAMFSFTSAGFSNFRLDGLTVGSARKASGDGSVFY